MTNPPPGAGDVDMSEVPDYSALSRLDGQVHLVLGAGRGIGRQVAHGLGQLGATVICVDNSLERAQAVAAEVGGLARHGDIIDRSQMEELFAWVDREVGRLDGVSDIVGLARYKPVLEATDEDWEWHFDLVVRHAFLAIQAATPLLKRSQNASFTFVSSVAGLLGSANLSLYAAQKAALISLVKSAATELGPLGIRVNSVAPGIVRTPRAIANPKWTPELVAKNAEMTPLGRLAVPSDIASTMLFLICGWSAQITGQTIVVDGGFSTVFHQVSPSG